LPSWTWIAGAFYMFMILLWNTYFAAVRHFVPFYINFFTSHATYVYIAAFSTYLFVLYVASETANHVKVKLV
jgi:hypothetical protein